MGILDRMTGRARTAETNPEAEAAPAVVSVPTHAERMASLEQARASVSAATDRRITDLRRQVAQAREDGDREIARLEADAAKVRQGVAAELTSRWLDAAGPLVRAWVEEPSRVTGRALAAGLVDLRDRVAFGLGLELDPWLLVVPFADLVLESKPGAVDTFVGINAAMATSPLSLAHRAIQSLDVVPSFVDRIADLESELQRIGATSSASPKPENVARWRVIRANVVDRGARTDALVALNAQIEADYRAGLPQAIGNHRVI